MFLVQSRCSSKRINYHQSLVAAISLRTTLIIGLCGAAIAIAEESGCKYGGATKPLFSSVVIVDASENVIVRDIPLAQTAYKQIVLKCVPVVNVGRDDDPATQENAEWVEVKLSATLAI